MKKTISDPITDGCLIMLLNEFNSFLEDMEKFSNSCGDSIYYCNAFDSQSMKRCTKIDGV